MTSKNLLQINFNVKKYFSINNLPYLIILLITFIVSTPLLKTGFYTIHDDQQIARLFLFDQSLFAGQFPPRWVNSLGFGFGYPLFLFYPPFVYILGELYHLFGFGFITSIKLVFFSSILFSGITMYVFSKEHFGKMAGLIGAIFYIMVPYRALDVYVRGALAESFSFVWLPLILWSFYKLEKTKNTLYLFLSSIFLALLMITHNLIFLPFALILFLYLFFQIIFSTDKIKLALLYLTSIILAFCLSAFFWMPSLIEKKYTLVNQILLTELADFKIHFVFPQQLWNWPWGFGGSAPGLADGISFKIGKIHIIMSGAAFLLSLVILINSKFKFKKNGLLISLSFLLFLFSTFMTTFYSEFIWNAIPQLAYLQFPWRFLIFTALFSSFLAAAFIYQLKLPFLKLIASGALLCLLIIPNFKLFKPQFYRQSLTDQKATSNHEINWYVSSSSFEYIPNSVDLHKTNLGTSFPNVTEAEIPATAVDAIDNTSQINILKSIPGKLSFTTNSQSATILKVNIFNFPGWQAKIDSQKAVISDNNKLKLITLNIPEGYHRISLEFKNTKIRTIANVISLFSIFFLVILVIKKWTKQY